MKPRAVGCVFALASLCGGIVATGPARAQASETVTVNFAAVTPKESFTDFDPNVTYDIVISGVGRRHIRGYPNQYYDAFYCFAGSGCPNHNGGMNESSVTTGRQPPFDVINGPDYPAYASSHRYAIKATGLSGRYYFSSSEASAIASANAQQKGSQSGSGEFVVDITSPEGSETPSPLTSAEAEFDKTFDNLGLTGIDTRKLHDAACSDFSSAECRDATQFGADLSSVFSDAFGFRAPITRLVLMMGTLARATTFDRKPTFPTVDALLPVLLRMAYHAATDFGVRARASAYTALARLLVLAVNQDLNAASS